MRRISTGVQGRSILGNFVATTNIFTTRETNQSLVLDPDGTGQILAEGDLRINGQIGSLILESSNGNEIKIETTTTSSSYTLTMPENPPTNGEVLIVDGSGNLIFNDINLPVSNQSSDTSIYYPLMTTSTSGEIISLNVSSNKFNFQPSTGILSVDELQSSGEVVAFSASDVALKENISPINESIEKINQLNGVSYDWKDDYIKSKGGEDGYFVRKRDIGLIAQDVEKVLPEIVAVNSKGFKAIKYDRIVALLVEAVKEQSKEIKKLKEIYQRGSE